MLCDYFLKRIFVIPSTGPPTMPPATYPPTKGKAADTFILKCLTTNSLLHIPMNTDVYSNIREFKSDIYGKRQTAKIVPDFAFFPSNP